MKHSQKLTSKSELYTCITTTIIIIVTSIKTALEWLQTCQGLAQWFLTLTPQAQVGDFGHTRSERRGAEGALPGNGVFWCLVRLGLVKRGRCKRKLGVARDTLSPRPLYLMMPDDLRGRCCGQLVEQS